MDNMELLKAKDAIFRLIDQCYGCFLGTDGNYYMTDYYESALERAFAVLGFDKDEVPLMEFCQAWEDNNRKLWAIELPDMLYGGWLAYEYYDKFVGDYEKWADSTYTGEEDE